MLNQPIALLELALAEEEARHSAALAAIRARANDIAEAERLARALTARGYKLRALVDTRPVGSLATCRIQFWLSCTRAEFSAICEWLASQEITLTRMHLMDLGELTVYDLTLGRQTIRLNVALNDPAPLRFRFRPADLPEVA